jgi:hypothetical protein
MNNDNAEVKAIRTAQRKAIRNGDIDEMLRLTEELTAAERRQMAEAR